MNERQLVVSAPAPPVSGLPPEPRSGAECSAIFVVETRLDRFKLYRPE